MYLCPVSKRWNKYLMWFKKGYFKIYIFLPAKTRDALKNNENTGYDEHSEEMGMKRAYFFVPVWVLLASVSNFALPFHVEAWDTVNTFCRFTFGCPNVYSASFFLFLFFRYKLFRSTFFRCCLNNSLTLGNHFVRTSTTWHRHFSVSKEKERTIKKHTKKWNFDFQSVIKMRHKNVRCVVNIVVWIKVSCVCSAPPSQQRCALKSVGCVHFQSKCFRRELAIQSTIQMDLYIHALMVR